MIASLSSPFFSATPQRWVSFRPDAMDDDISDILGRPTLHNVRGHRSGAFSGLSIVLSIPAVLILYWVAAQIWERFLIWREKSYKLCTPISPFSPMCEYLQLFIRAMRRRHGIPDNDHRPFNVAYAAVVRTRQEEEVASRRAKVHQVLMQDQPVAPPNENIRHRQGLIISVPTSSDPVLISDCRSFTQGFFGRASGCSREI